MAPGSPSARGLEVTHCRVARGFPRAGWLGVSSSPVAPGLSLPEGPDLPIADGSGFPLRRLPSRWSANVYDYRRDRTRGSGQQFQDSLAVHKPSTVNPRLSPATGPSPPDTPQGGPQGPSAARGAVGQRSAG